MKLLGPRVCCAPNTTDYTNKEPCVGAVIRGVMGEARETSRSGQQLWCDLEKKREWLIQIIPKLIFEFQINNK